MGVLEFQERSSPSAPWLMIRLRMARLRHQIIAQLACSPGPSYPQEPRRRGRARSAAQQAGATSSDGPRKELSAPTLPHKKGCTHGTRQEVVFWRIPRSRSRCKATHRAGQSWSPEATQQGREQRSEAAMGAVVSKRTSRRSRGILAGEGPWKMESAENGAAYTLAQRSFREAQMIKTAPPRWPVPSLS